jgi:uncharacterized protein
MMTLALTGECNLRCRYCYQNAKSAMSMPRQVAEASASRLLESASRRVELVFAGGEPLLAFDLIEHVVAYVERRRGPRRVVKYSLATNGTLLRPQTTAFLEEHEFGLLLSFDGVLPAQAVRGKRSFARLDELLDRLRTDAPELFWQRLTVGITLDADAVSLLSESFHYFLDKHVPAITISPANGQHARWTPQVMQALERELKQIFATSRRLYAGTGQVPFVPFQRASERAQVERDVVCGAAACGSVTIDVDGEAYACPMFAESSQKFANQRLAPAIEPMRMGHVADAEFWRRLAELPARARATGMFHFDAGRHSLHGDCARCRYRSDCRACPLSVLAEPGGDDVRRIPDYLCAFNWTLMGLRARFPRQPDAAALLDGRSPKPAFVRELLKRVEAIRGRAPRVPLS